jgi:voltage-gated potassium channel
MRPTVEQLAVVPLFASLDEPQLEAIASLMEVREDEAGTRLVGEGAPGHALFVLLEGTAAVTVGEHLRQPLAPGEFFGEIALLETSERTASVVAKTDMRLVALTESAFKQLVENDPAAGRECEAALRERWASPIS